MKHPSNGFYLGILLLILLTMGCGIGTFTLGGNGSASRSPQGIIKQGGGMPTLPSGPVLPKLVLSCVPPVPAISKINSFCANQTAGLGGVTYVGPAQYNWAYTDNDYCDSTKIPKVTCSGPQGRKFQMEICQACNLPQPQALGPFVCSNGYVNDGNGNCIDVNPTDVANGINWTPCPSGSHYDNGLQNCADDVTDQLASPCPADHPYYIPDFHYCLAKAYPVVYNCQTFSLQLGECPPLRRSAPSGNGQCPAGQTYTCNPLLGGACSCK